MSIRLLSLVAIATFALACGKTEEGASAGEAGAPAAEGTAAAKTPGAPDGTPYTVTHKVEGDGAQPSAADTVRVHYAGRLADGTEFDSSIARNEPATFPLSGVIPCWTQGVAEMKVGGKATLVCPPDMAYGANGIPGVIPANATLTFEVELLGIEPAAQ